MLATAPQEELPFKVVEFHNRRTGSRSWRVTGSGAKNGRVRKNFSVARGGEAAARSECERLNADEIRAAAQLPALRALPTRLSEEEITAAEAAKQKAKGRWELSHIIDAGLVALESRGADVLVAPLFDVWQAGPAKELGKRWRSDVSKTVKRFIAAHPALTSTKWTTATTREWLDAQDVSGQTKANYRNALRRFGSWLCERLGLDVNPASGLSISRSKTAETKKKAPAILLPRQVEALLVACSSDMACRRGLGWLVECVFVGLRPENEAPHAVWSEIDLAAGEQKVLGYKRGIKPRTVQLRPTARQWLREWKRLHDSLPPGALLAPYSTDRRRAAVQLANGWLAARYPSEPKIVWEQDILRHTFASMRAAEGITMEDLALEMGTSVAVIYGHYRHTRSPREAEAFWALTPSVIAKLVG